MHWNGNFYTGPNKYLDKIKSFRINNAPLEMIHHIVLGEENSIYVNKSNRTLVYV